MKSMNKFFFQNKRNTRSLLIWLSFIVLISGIILILYPIISEIKSFVALFFLGFGAGFFGAKIYFPLLYKLKRKKRQKNFIDSINKN
ncbi:MAG: hypothetical protein BWX59_01596 [Bacteroidetes bacterium ADurb.Bin028]|nr:MAG: hypothetical protein BWX59_01596 [Bacteroidetes bacterium ADurb.Bin028]